MSISSASLPYHEPDIVTILIQASFLLVLNAVNYVLDNLLYCGLVGQLLIGIAWGTPGAKWLPNEVETVIVQLGYLGLILLVYEGTVYGTPKTSIESQLRYARWTIDIFPIPQSKHHPINFGSSHRNMRSNRALVRPSGHRGRYSTPSLCCRSCIMFHQLGHDLHHFGNHGTYRYQTWRRSNKCSYA